MQIFEPNKSFMGIVARVAVKRNKQRYYLRQLIVSKLKLKIENFKIFVGNETNSFFY